MNVLCQHCKEVKATVHIMDNFPEKRERHLCEECAIKEGVIFKQNQETTNEILHEFLKHKVVGLKEGDDLTCPQCGMSFREFQSRGLLGCPHDYDIFRDALLPLIQRAHEEADHHVGKVPVRVDENVRKQTGLLRLRRELKEAVEQEDYEVAARVRDQIQSLEST